ncbi:DUF885 domain-containing protein [Schlesneria paludicola]|uniref:DUF885 domain-containing protein n=1 Tax=Schlesneria paludicola TaxID=360056 RepID=UPI00029ADC7D|nr:DUF885 domain-containing protein [Schlesneria paludicola]
MSVELGFVVRTLLLSVIIGSAASVTFAQSATERLQALFDDEWQYQLRESPIEASYLGDKRYNDKWPDVSLGAIKARHEHQRTVLSHLATIDSSKLSDSDRLNVDLFRRQLTIELDEIPFQWYLVPLNQREGIQDESSVADAMSFQSVKDFEDWLARLRSFPEYMDQTIALMRAGIAAGMVQPQVVMKRLPAQIKRQIVEEPTASLYYKPFKSFPSEIAIADRERLQREAQAVIRERIVPSYRKFFGFFEREYYPSCLRGIGASQWPQGTEFYAFLARKYTTTNLSPQQIHEIGLAEVKRIRIEMERIKNEVGFNGSLTDFFEHLRTAPQFHFTDPNDLMKAYVTFCQRIDPQLPRIFKTLPRIPYQLDAIPAQMAADTTTAYYRPPSADGSRPGTFFVNLYKPETRPKYEIAALSLHEAVPGHHLQIALATEMGNVPEFRKHSHFTSYVEGWGLYSESLGDEMGLYDDPYAKFGQLTYEVWRSVRLVVDTGMHSMKWTREEAIQYFKENAAKTELDIVNEIDRYIAWPGQALAYKIGELKIKELRQRARTKLGDQFDLRQFHDVVLRNGAVPLDILEQLVNDWIAHVK